jgi:hypothetical protein
VEFLKQNKEYLLEPPRKVQKIVQEENPMDKVAN